MSNLLRPVGPLSPRVYWARRLAVLVLALLVVIVTATIVVKVAGGSDSQVGAGAKKGSGKDSKPGSSGTPVDCTKEDLGLTLSANGSTFAAGQEPTFSVEVSNVSETPCSVDVNAKTLSIDVVSGKDEIWSSSFCAKAKPELLLIGGDDVHAVATVWDRMRNDKECSSKAKVAAKPGTYRATANLRGSKSQELVFTLN